MDKNIHFVTSSEYYNEEFRIYDIAYLTNNIIISTDIIGQLIYYEINNDLSSFNKKDTNQIYSIDDLDNLVSIFSIDILSENILLGSSKDEVMILKDNKISDKYTSEKSKGISKVKFISENLISAGDFKGNIILYDIRQKPPIKIFSEQSEEITDILYDKSHPNFLLSSSIDSTLSVYDLSKNSLYALSDKMDEELNCLLSYKNENYILCGSGEGNILIYNWDRFGDYKDRIIGQNEGINDMSKYDENIFFTGSEDGLIRICTMYPKKMRGLLKSKNDKNNIMNDVNKIKISEDKKSLIIASGMDCIKLFDISNIDFSKIYKANNEFDSEENSENVEKEKNNDIDKDDDENEEEDGEIDDDEEGGEIEDDEENEEVDDDEEGEEFDDEEEEGEEINVKKQEKRKQIISITNKDENSDKEYEKKEEKENNKSEENKEDEENEAKEDNSNINEEKKDRKFLNKKRKKNKETSENESEEKKGKKEKEKEKKKAIDNEEESESDLDSSSFSKNKKSKKVKKIGKQTKSLIAKEQRKAFFNDL